jgi:uncharacterized hydrophobic protein (TIGR00271 family)
MTMLRLRIICAEESAGAVTEALGRQVGVIGVRRAGSTSHGAEVTAALARESADEALAELRRLGVYETGMISLEPLDTAVGHLATRAEGDAPGEGADAMIWDELASRTGEDSTLTGTFIAFMILATLLASIGVVTDSQVTIVGAMVVGPEFGPLAGLAVGLVQRRYDYVRRGAVALLVGFPAAIVATGLLSLIARATGLIRSENLVGAHRETEFIYHPGWFSLITALLAGTAGMLSLTSSKSAALVGVFISVTTIPAAGNAAVAGVLGQWHETWQSVAQLGINLIGIVAAGVATLAIRKAVTRPRAA